FSVTVTALDQFNNTAMGYLGTLHFTSTDGAAVLPANYTFVAGDAGVHTFTNGVTLKTAGNRTVTATDSFIAGISGTATVDVATVEFAVQNFSSGLYRFSTATASWQLLTANNGASSFAVDAQGDVVALFPGYGVYRFEDSTGFVQLTANANANSVAIDARGDVLAVFPGYGLYR